MKSGYMVRFDYDDKNVAYGVIIWIDGIFAHIDYVNPVTREPENKPKLLTSLIKIGTP